MLELKSKKISSWQQAISQSITDPRELFELLELDMNDLPQAIAATELFPLRVQHSFVARMQKGNLQDPLLMQVLPIGKECIQTENYSADPLQEKNVNPLPGLLHKYQGRVLLTVTGICGVNCRFCFRREFAYDENNPGKFGWKKVIEYIASDTSIDEIIFSGGDPLVANDPTLAELAHAIAEIPHVKTLRIHSRMPIVLPERITEEFLQWFTHSRLNPVMVVHCNHPNEINDEVKAALKKLRQANVILLNQAVLLKEINDSTETLIELSKKLMEMGVMPYYLHMLDKVQGAAHFAVTETQASQILQEMAGRVAGYLVPKLVKEVPGALAKVPVSMV